MNLHDLITLMILPIGTSGTNEIQYIKYTSESHSVVTNTSTFTSQRPTMRDTPIPPSVHLFLWMKNLIWDCFTLQICIFMLQFFVVKTSDRKWVISLKPIIGILQTSPSNDQQRGEDLFP